LVAVHAGIGARAFRTALNRSDALIRIWKADPDLLNIEMIDVPAFGVHYRKNQDWNLIIDDWVLRRMSMYRKEKLPVETGGVLVGHHDMQRRIVYVVDAFSSPPDSIEWPCLYIRGCEELSTRVGEIRKITAGNLDYVGEWHSHPDGCSVAPSADDTSVFDWIAEELVVEQKPSVLLIAGQDDKVGAFWFRMRREPMEVLCPY